MRQAHVILVTGRDGMNCGIGCFCVGICSD
jgi:hypothetical protein